MDSSSTSFMLFVLAGVLAIFNWESNITSLRRARKQSQKDSNQKQQLRISGIKLITMRYCSVISALIFIFAIVTTGKSIMSSLKMGILYVIQPVNLVCVILTFFLWREEPKEKLYVTGNEVYDNCMGTKNILTNYAPIAVVLFSSIAFAIGMVNDKNNLVSYFVMLNITIIPCAMWLTQIAVWNKQT